MIWSMTAALRFAAKEDPGDSIRPAVKHSPGTIDPPVIRNVRALAAMANKASNRADQPPACVPGFAV